MPSATCDDDSDSSYHVEAWVLLFDATIIDFGAAGFMKVLMV